VDEVIIVGEELAVAVMDELVLCSELVEVEFRRLVVEADVEFMF
jgi:hypothetical protein